jgi:NDP-sugar pyrophosphorylase family protein
MRAMILAAGFGTRLWPLTVDRTKPAIPILGRPLIGFVAEYLSRFGVDEVLVNLHHEPESVRSALGSGREFGVNLSFIEEKEILGTSGALDNARDFFDGSTFVVANGKIITDLDLGLALETHRRRNAIATLVLLQNKALERFSEVLTEEGRVVGFGGMPNPASDNEEAPLMFTGIQILEPRIFDYIPRGQFSHSTTDVYPKAIAAGEIVAAHIADGMWYELSTIRRYLDISLTLLNHRGLSVYLGKDCSVSSSASVTESILWDDVRVEDSANIGRCIIGDGVTLPAGSYYSNSVIVRSELLAGKSAPEKALKGFVDGANFVVPLAQ